MYIFGQEIINMVTLCGNSENMNCSWKTNVIDKEVSECKVDMTFMGRGCQKCTKCLAWSKIINVIAFASAGDICFVIPKVNNIICVSFFFFLSFPDVF